MALRKPCTPQSATNLNIMFLPSSIFGIAPVLRIACVVTLMCVARAADVTAPWANLPVPQDQAVKVKWKRDAYQFGDLDGPIRSDVFASKVWTQREEITALCTPFKARIERVVYTDGKADKPNQRTIVYFDGDKLGTLTLPSRTLMVKDAASAGPMATPALPFMDVLLELRKVYIDELPKSSVPLGMLPSYVGQSDGGVTLRLLRLIVQKMPPAIKDNTWVVEGVHKPSGLEYSITIGVRHNALVDCLFEQVVPGRKITLWKKVTYGEKHIVTPDGGSVVLPEGMITVIPVDREAKLSLYVHDVLDSVSFGPVSDDAFAYDPTVANVILEQGSDGKVKATHDPK